MTGYNKIILLGTVATNPDIQEKVNDNNIATFKLAVTDNRTPEDLNPITQYFSITVKGSLVNEVKCFVKQDQEIYLEGTVISDVRIDSNNIEWFSTQILVEAPKGNIYKIDYPTQTEQSLDRPELPFNITV